MLRRRDVPARRLDRIRVHRDRVDPHAHQQLRVLRVHRRRLPAKSGEVEPLVDWLSGVAALLEEVAPLVEEVTPYTAGFTPGLPYGQISDVDPTSRTW